jgi:hypothetical protein
MRLEEIRGVSTGQGASRASDVAFNGRREIFTFLGGSPRGDSGNDWKTSFHSPQSLFVIHGQGSRSPSETETETAEETPDSLPTL